MKKRSFLFFCSTLIILSCNKKSDTNPEISVEDSTSVVIDHHTSQLSLDYIGTYKGIIPCADCEGIETTLKLLDESNYELETIYKGKSKTPFVNKGSYSWHESGNKIKLDGIKDSEGASQFQVIENGLIQLDIDGSRITGELGRKYLLQKQLPEIEFDESEAAAVMQQVKAEIEKKVAEQAVAKVFSILGTKWQLVELNGKPVTNKDAKTKPYFIQLNKDNRFAAFAGCNSMMGQYELNQETMRIKFSKVAATLMACQDMEVEQAFAKVIETVDNYSLSGNSLSLNKARMAPLARFEAVE
jgi:copper homeostasis protein (lipoprotein)